MKTSAKSLLLLLPFICAAQLSGQPYWINGTGAWDTTTTNWSATTGGPNTLTWTNGGNALIRTSAILAGTITVDAGGISLTNFGNSGASLYNYTITGGNLALAGPSTWTVGGSTGAQFVVESVITGATTLTKAGTRLLVFAGNNSYTGDTTISAGTLQLGNGGATGSVAGNINITGATAKVAFNRSDSYSYGGTISGIGGLIQAGSGTVTLTGANSYTGTTAVNAGTLALGANNAVTTTGAMTLAGGEFDLAGFNQSLGALTLGASSTIDFGGAAGANSLTFANSSAATWLGTLNVINFDFGLDTLRFGPDATGLTGGQLASININGASAVIDANGFLAAIPEPSTYALFAGLLALTGVCWHRRRTFSRT